MSRYGSMLEVQLGVGAAYTSLHTFTIGIGNVPTTSMALPCSEAVEGQVISTYSGLTTGGQS